jgi:hypothetical protein
MENNKEYFNGGIIASNVAYSINIERITRRLIIKEGLKEVKSALIKTVKKLTSDEEFLSEVLKTTNKLNEINENESKYERKYIKIRY